jgi:hypothetical protein
MTIKEKIIYENITITSSHFFFPRIEVFIYLFIVFFLIFGRWVFFFCIIIGDQKNLNNVVSYILLDLVHEMNIIYFK